MEKPPLKLPLESLSEETGYSILIDTSAEPVVSRTPFFWSGEWYDSTTHYFRARVLPGDLPKAPRSATYEVGVEWIPLSEVFKTFAYNPVIQRSVCSLLLKDLFKTFDDFYPYYLAEHANAANRLLHLVGTSLGILLVTFGVLASKGWLILLGIRVRLCFRLGRPFFNREEPAGDLCLSALVVER